ncbi:MAG: hypothetical protein ACLQU2_29095 [Candidatus Binataceae bacterium]
MDAAKGERYARIFRKAGTFIGKGNIARAIEVLKEGVELAQTAGDSTMARRFGDEIKRLSTPNPAAE